MRRAVIGLLVAACAGLVAADASVFGVAVWKIALALLGLVLFVSSGRGSGKSDAPQRR
jgi:hypothetical protein